MLLLAAGCTAQPALDDRYPVKTIAIDATNLTVWVGDQPSSRQRGLIGLVELPRGIDGMLFVWDSPGSRSFHMTDTLIPLDIWWFDSDGALIGSTTMEPCRLAPCPAYLSPRDVLWALETPAGERDLAMGAILSTG